MSFKELDKLNKSATLKIFFSKFNNQKESYRKVIKVMNKGAGSGHDKNIPDATFFKPINVKNRERISPFPVPEKFRNLIVGSSRAARIKTETLPNDSILQSYRQSTSEEKN